MSAWLLSLLGFFHYASGLVRMVKVVRSARVREQARAKEYMHQSPFLDNNDVRIEVCLGLLNLTRAYADPAKFLLAITSVTKVHRSVC